MELILLSELLELWSTALFRSFIKTDPFLGDKMDVQIAFSSDESTVIRVPPIRIPRIWTLLPWKFPLAVATSSSSNGLNTINIICLSSSQTWVEWTRLWFYILGGFTLRCWRRARSAFISNDIYNNNLDAWMIKWMKYCFTWEKWREWMILMLKNY